MKATRVQRLAALPCALSRVCLLARAAGALVPAALLRRPHAPEEEGDPKPKARGNLELDVRKPSGRRGGRCQEPGAGARAAASPEASPLRGLQCSEEALPGSLSAPTAEEPLPLLERWRPVLPKPRSLRRGIRNPSGLVQVDLFCGEGRCGLLQGGRPARCGRRQDRVGGHL